MKQRTHFILLSLVLLASFLIRTIGTKPGFWAYHPDEPATYDSAISMIINGDLNPRRFDYPAGVPLIHMAVFRSIFIPINFVKLTISEPQMVISALKNFEDFPKNISEELFGRRGVNALFWSRYITAVLGMLCVAAIYMLSAILFSPTVGLIAAFFLSFNYLHVLRSHLALTDIPNTLFTLIALIAIAKLLKKDSPKNYYLSGITIGLAFSVKFQLFLIFPYLLVHLVWSIRKKSFANFFRKEVFFSAILAIFTFLMINPYLPFHLKPVPVARRIDSFITANEIIAKRYAFGSNIFNPFPIFYLYKWGIGKALTLSILGGAALMLFQSPLLFFLLLSIIFPFMYAFVYYGGAGAAFYVRNLVAIVPLLLVFSAYFYSKLFAYVGKRGILVSLILIGVAWSQITSSTKLSYYWSKPWLYMQMIDWASDHLPKDARYEESSGIVMTILRDKGGFTDIDNRWGREQMSVVSLAEMEEDGADFGILVSNQIQTSFISWMNPLSFSELLDYDDVSFSFLDNTYVGLSVHEMLQNNVYELHYPIFVPNNFIFVTKLPLSVVTPLVRHYAFEFNEASSIWDVDGLTDNGMRGKFRWNEGSLIIDGAVGQTARFTSPVLSVTEGKTYKIIGRVKYTDNVPKEERSAFLRIDMYANNQEATTEEKGSLVTVSARSWGEPGWKEVSVLTPKIPKGISVMKISFQTRGNSSYKAYLDSVEVWEVKPGAERYPEVPYVPYTLPPQYFYPKSVF
ncbi:hypothetical protein A3A79_04825 [Candidatus Gottesmanbacteria bacterium RIFCSPLOWO2_01_FULL_43_11b]|uniref:Glycosyltransferase RgtA/B/C/D-like domain-containing protein n=1 Tax=Candidatus Gottesmanbacteria bacterium RIFCSPLOWO2_01_FULL_43_11b TaxID=1798392 RepID=A0A1F6AIC3_9BACT|nr:MAG: hypothetical protein A3A79_04825 [Candidatus Gottesmanbacteria bacterium RIFCSPLOWO2_01_FULL_43_11b]